MTLTDDGGMEFEDGCYLDKADVEALELCIAIARQDPAYAKRIDDRFAEGESFWDVSTSACFHVQQLTGNLTSEQVPPAYANSSNDPNERSFRKKLVRFGISPFVPDPWRSLKAARAARETLKRKGLLPDGKPPKRPRGLRP